MKETDRMESGLCLVIDLPNKKGGFGQKKPQTNTPPFPQNPNKRRYKWR